MSILKNIVYTTPVVKIRSFFFLLAVVGLLLGAFPTPVFAEEASSAAFSQNIYHQHTGGASGGGCYNNKKTGTRTEEEPCRGTMVYYASYDKTQCNKCGAGYYGDQSGRDCWHKTTKTVSYTYYDLGCGKSASTLVGTVSVTPSTDEWTKSLQLTASYSGDGMSVAECPYIWNGGPATAENTYTVSANGAYTLQLNADGNANTAAAVVTIPIANIDVTAPTVIAHSLQPQSEWTNEGVQVVLEEVKDLQPDGSEGGGLHELPYSYDGGQTWTQENSYLYNENGTHTVWVRDALENMGSLELFFTNIDTTPPVISDIDYDITTNIHSTRLSVSAQDLQPDGSEGSGLHEKPYSFDGGATWDSVSEKQIDTNGSIVIAVRDKLNNVVYEEISISNLDRDGPTIHYKMEKDSWTNEDVKLYLQAEDVNADGSSGAGIPDEWYSLDGGVTWSGEEMLVYENNCELSILARDIHDNRTSMNISIQQIDKDAPTVSIHSEVIGDEDDMRVLLTIHGEDGGSGLHEEAYSWDKGISFGEAATRKVTENGIYEVAVRDKAGNYGYAQTEITYFKDNSEEKPVIVQKEVLEEPEIVTPEEPEPATESKIRKVPKTEKKEQKKPVTEETPVQIPEQKVAKAAPVYNEPRTETVEVAKKGWGIEEWLILATVLAALLFLALLLLLLLRTVAILAEGEDGKMKFMALQWIHAKEGRYEVHIDESLLEQCVTTHFVLRPGCLFVFFHKNEQLSCLFPESVCILLSIQKEMDFSLL